MNCSQAYASQNRCQNIHIGDDSKELPPDVTDVEEIWLRKEPAKSFYSNYFGVFVHTSPCLPNRNKNTCILMCIHILTVLRSSPSMKLDTSRSYSLHKGMALVAPSNCTSNAPFGSALLSSKSLFTSMMLIRGCPSRCIVCCIR